jgi:heavy metal sensor kinase
MGRVWYDAPLRWRLTAFYVALLATTLVILSLLLYTQLARFLISDAQARLIEGAAPAIARHLNGPVPPRGPAGASEPLTREARALANELSTRDLAAVIFGSGGNLLASGQMLPDGQTLPEQLTPPTPATDELNRALAGQTVFFQVADSTGRALLTCLVPLRANNAIDDLLARLRLALVFGTLSAVVVGIMAGVPLARAALRPLQRVTATSERIAAGDLSQRTELPRRDDEIGRLAAAFDTMVDRLEGALRSQRQFVADASHELRTPLTALGGLVELHLMGVEGNDPVATRETFRAIHREIGRLTRLVRDLLTLSRFDAQLTLQRRACDLSGLVAEVIAQVRHLAGDRALVCRTVGVLSLVADPDRLRQVLLNLLDNAVAFTGPTGTITVTLDRTATMARLLVADDGPGIPAADLPHLFERFYRGDKSRARRPDGGGSGLGLAIAQAIIEAHGGTIDARSTPDQGTTFTILLPLHSPAELPLPTLAARVRAAQ